MTETSRAFASLAGDLPDTLGALARPRRVSVTQGAADALVISDGGGYTGAWTPEQVPYLAEPMDLLGGRRYEAVCFVGPARTGKTAGLILGWMAHALTNDIGRMMVMHMTEKKAAMLSKLDVDTAIAASDKLRALRSPRAHDDTVGLKIFRHGMAIRFAWPSPSELAATTYRYVALTDYDRYPRTGLGGEVFDTAHKRTETLMSRRKTLVESSPEREMEDPHWSPATPHEAPPCGGILGIYNRGDRRRWYWPCPHCREYFEAAPGLSLFSRLPPEAELLEDVRSMDIGRRAREWSQIYCPRCAGEITQADKHRLNRAGVWLQDGQHIDPDGTVHGDERHTTIASFWLGGVAAAYQTWLSIVTRYLQGLQQFALTGSEQALQATTYTDQAMPYTTRALLDEADREAGMHIDDSLERFHVPPWARFLVAFVDVQAGRRAGFVVQVHAVGVDMEQAIVDRYHMTDAADPRRVIDPAAYAEDWDVLTARVVNATYRLGDGRELRVLATGVDTGGEKGVTPQAYAWYGRLRTAGLSGRVYLTKGASAKQRHTVLSAKGRDERGRPLPWLRLYLTQTDELKNQIDAALRRKTPGPTYMHFPAWLPPSFFDELRAEVRSKDGKWRKLRDNAANEALDCWAGVLAVCYILGPANPQKRFPWDAPPAWALPLDAGNSEIVTRDERRELQAPAPTPRKRGFRRHW